MKKKLLAGIMALALCSTSMPQMIFAEEFTSGVLEEATPEETEETPEVFTDENQAAAGDELGGVSEFSSEEVSEFDDDGDNVAVATDTGDTITTIDITNPSSSDSNYSYSTSDQICRIQKPGSYRFNGNNTQTFNRIVIENITSDTVSIYLNNVNINTSAGPALLISQNIAAQVYIYLEGNNILKTTNEYSAALQKDNVANLTINTDSTNSGNLTSKAEWFSDPNGNLAKGAGIGGGYQRTGSGISILGGSITASSGFGAGIGGGSKSTGNGISISGGSVTASSSFGAGIGGGSGTAESSCGTGSNISISGGSVTASSRYGAGIGGGSYSTGSDISISGGSVTASSYSGAGIGGGTLSNASNISISGGSVNANIGCTPTLYPATSVTTGIVNPEVYLCEIPIPNPTSAKVAIDDSPYIHSGSNPRDTNLYAWLTGEDHYITVGSEKKAYIFDSITKTFSNNKRTLSSSDFEFVAPNDLTYDNCAKKATVKAQSGIKGAENITVKYFLGNTPVSDPTNAGTYTVKIDVSYSDFNQRTEDLTDESWTLTIKPKPITVAIENKEKIYGETNPSLAFTVPDDALVGNDTKESLGITLKTDAETLSPAGNYSIKLDSYTNKNYAINASEGTLTIKKSNQTPNLPTQTQKSVPWSCKKVGDITDLLPEHWNWADSSKELQVGANSVTAVYDGTDKGNYETENVTYTITRENCHHPHTVDRYYSSASCTSSGYSGNTYCADCGTLLSSGYTISAYGHSYDDSVITTAPTAETDGVVTYTCKRCKHQETRTLGKLNDGEPYIDGDFLSKGWDSVKEIIKKSKEKDIVSITLNGAQTLPASVLSELKGKDIDLSLNMENGFIWKINGTSITAETPVDVNLSVAKATDYIPASLYKLISTNQNDFAFHLGASGTFDFPMVLSVKTDASCAGLMANLFWYDAQNQILQCIQSVTVSGALERSIPYADFTLSKGQDYFVAFSTEALNGRSIHADGSITDENGSYLRPADTSIASYSVDRNKLTVKLAKGCAGAQGYDFVVGKSSNMTQTGKFSKTVSSQNKPQASFKYLAKGTCYVAARSWVLDEQGNKVYGYWSAVKKFKITVVTAQQPKIKEVKVKGNTVTITYTKCKNADGYEIVLGTEYKTSTDEKYPVKKYVKRTKNTTTVTFTNVKKGTWYVGIRSWTQPSKAKYKTYSPYSAMKKFKIKK